MLQDSDSKVLVTECTDLSEITTLQYKQAAGSRPPSLRLSLCY